MTPTSHRRPWHRWAVTASLHIDYTPDTTRTAARRYYFTTRRRAHAFRRLLAGGPALPVTATLERLPPSDLGPRSYGHAD